MVVYEPDPELLWPELPELLFCTKLLTVREMSWKRLPAPSRNDTPNVDHPWGESASK
jgi:hypothetical protein